MMIHHGYDEVSRAAAHVTYPYCTSSFSTIKLEISNEEVPFAFNARPRNVRCGVLQ
jgi:hypothetical protein